MASVFVRALDRKNMVGTYDYSSGIDIVLNNLPQRWANWVNEQTDLWSEEIPVLIYKSISGIKLGYKDDPLVWNDDHTELGLSSSSGFSVKRLEGEIDWDDPNILEVEKTENEDGSENTIIIVEDDTKPLKRLQGEIDWNDPNIYSPYMDIETKIHYNRKDALVHAAAEHAALTWTQDPLEQDAGDTEEYIIERKRTPFRYPRIPDTEG